VWSGLRVQGRKKALGARAQLCGLEWVFVGIAAVGMGIVRLRPLGLAGRVVRTGGVLARLHIREAPL